MRTWFWSRIEARKALACGEVRRTCQFSFLDCFPSLRRSKGSKSSTQEQK